ncbi:hypothetical protein [Methanosarcina sp.]|uniref:hypothetical protein n=1 Tax=Methanosarcina sp. TaxID=2213 RepID=UPI002ABBC66A|nr:hypothetical protein [Methanosarcina sp.]MDY9924903.1 hypothetical protein [Methanosarcina sp.]
MHQFMKAAGYTVAALGVAYVVKHMKHRKEGSRGWHKIKVEEEKKTGSRYGSDPIRY